MARHRFEEVFFGGESRHYLNFVVDRGGHGCFFLVSIKINLTLVVSAIHVGVALAVSTSSAGKFGSHVISGDRTSRGGIAKNTALDSHLLSSPAWLENEFEENGNEAPTCNFQK